MPMKSIDISLRYLRPKRLEFKIRKLFIELEVTRTIRFVLVSVTLPDIWAVYTTVKFVANTILGSELEYSCTEVRSVVVVLTHIYIDSVFSVT